MIIGLGSPFFASSIFVFPDRLYLVDAEFSSALLKNIPLMFTCSGAFSSFLLVHCYGTSKATIFSFKTTATLRSIITFLTKK
jgi:hypothetical protein